MINLLLQRIKDLENELKKTKRKNIQTKELIISLCKECKVSKEKKDAFKKKFLNILSKLETDDIETFYDDNNSLKYGSFLEIILNINRGYLAVIDGNMAKEKQKFVLGFLTNKISPFFTVSDNKIIGLLDESQLKEIKKLHKIPFFNSQNGEFSEIDIYKTVFDTENFELQTIQKAKQIFDEFRIRPSFKNKHYIEYSLVKDKIIDFEQEELNKQKRKYAFVFDEKYPNLEMMLKKEIKNISFVLALLEKIDDELLEIKESKGIQNIVNRMLNYIELNLPEEGVLEEVRFLRQRLSK